MYAVDIYAYLTTTPSFTMIRESPYAYAQPPSRVSRKLLLRVPLLPHIQELFHSSLTHAEHASSCQDQQCTCHMKPARLCDMPPLSIVPSVHAGFGPAGKHGDIVLLGKARYLIALVQVRVVRRYVATGPAGWKITHSRGDRRYQLYFRHQLVRRFITIDTGEKKWRRASDFGTLCSLSTLSLCYLSSLPNGSNAS